ncbi:alpha-2,8-polysialyltransferase family protein [Brevibacterium daeguense]|uniref:Alpha-2,8-polysialyltransferase family protein n=1 Tax=Brevibacterium daeguense TaxID=909936 RepID=A0ABP8EG41_9MICO|nr:alpha-2,8-polysialyltransferase family protein [Brevibacterium daeguense]
MKQVFVVSSHLQLMNLCAAIDEGLIVEADERILVASDNRVINEVGPSFAESDMVRPLLLNFDRMISLNEWIWPYHPNQWGPSNYDQPVISHLVEVAWGLEGHHLQLFVESLQGHPAIALAKILHRADIFVHSDGLMSYGPTRSVIAPMISQRIMGLLYMDLVPGVDPVLLSEKDVPLLKVSPAALRKQVEISAEALDDRTFAPDPDSVMIIGQYLSDVELFTMEEEIALYQRMLEEAIKLDPSKIFFKPHPAASASVNSILAHQAQLSGTEFELIEAKLPVEICASIIRPAHVISCFSTGMVTTWRLFDATASAFGTELALQKFAPYENSNRIPVTICDYLFGQDADAGTSSDDLAQLVKTVSYCMQAKVYPHLRKDAVAYLSDRGPAVSRYFKRRRLTKLRLPGQLPAPSLRQKAMRTGLRYARSIKGRVSTRKLSRGQ